MTKNLRKILLISNVPPCNNYPGGLVLEQLSRFLPKGSLVCFVTLDKKLEPKISPDLDWIPIEYYEKPREDWSGLPYRFRFYGSFLGEKYHQLVTRKKIVAKIVSFAKKHQVDTVWSVLEGQTSFYLGLAVAQKLKVTFLTEAWDPPHWWLTYNYVDDFSASSHLKQFALAIGQSQRFGAASWAMAEKYHRDYHVETVPFLPSINEKLAYPPAKRIHQREKLIIGVAGKLYASKEWQSLLEALNQLDWQIAGRQVYIRVMGIFAYFETYQKMQIEYLGWQSQRNALKLMNEADILYCPYWFDRGFEEEARLSFPSKLATYLASGRPVLFHGPKYASPAKFLENNNAGFCCYSLEKSEIIKSLKKLIDNQKMYAQLAQNGRLAFDRFLTDATLKKNFAKFLGIDEGELSS